jgi:tRNA U34 2-thiouridine synthase MnmA/TrmU
MVIVMSATSSHESASKFVNKVAKDQELRELVAEHGFEEAAERAGYDLDGVAIEDVMREFVKQGLPASDFEIQSDSPTSLTAHSGCSRCCS